MLDVHAPHKAIHGVGEFFLHLFTITVGLLIAVGIEAGVERHHHTDLAKQAQEMLDAEIRKNETTMTEALKDIQGMQQRNKTNLDSIAAVRKNPSQDVNIDVSYGSSSLEETAWHTAQETGALAYMPYDRAERYSSIYSNVHDFESAEARLAEDEAQFIGVLRRYDIGKGKMNREAADAVAEHLGLSQGHLLSVYISARVLEDEQSAFLQGREPNHHMSIRVGD